MNQREVVDDEATAFPASEQTPGQSESRRAYALFLKQLLTKPWKEDYERLRLEGWDYRKAAYIAWASSPVKDRWPETQAKLAEELGLKSARTIQKWRENDARIDRDVPAEGGVDRRKRRADPDDGCESFGGFKRRRT